MAAARELVAVAFGTRFSTTSTPGRAVRGQNEIGKCSECQAGASIASCRFILAWTWRRKNCAIHWSCWSPPGEPQERYGSPSRSAMVGDSVVRGRLPGASAAGWFSSSQNIWARLPRQKPISGMTGEDCSQPPDGVAEIMLPAVSMMSKCTVSPRTSPKRPTVGSPAPMAPTASR